MNNLSYIITDIKSNVSVIIDPTWNINTLLDTINAGSTTVSAIWLTHTHYDHIEGLDVILEKIPALPIFVHSLGVPSVSKYGVIHALDDGDMVSCGLHQFHVLHTPGHSPDSVCFYSAPHLICGDTLFVDRCGRADFSTSNPAHLYDSLQRLKALPKSTVIYPGHQFTDQITDTMHQQKMTNPYLKYDSESDFIRFRMKGRI